MDWKDHWGEEEKWGKCLFSLKTHALQRVWGLLAFFVFWYWEFNSGALPLISLVLIFFEIVSSSC